MADADDKQSYDALKQSYDALLTETIARHFAAATVTETPPRQARHAKPNHGERSPR
jgi:hypothetical protein